MIWLCRSIDPPISICSMTFHVRPHFAASPSHLPRTMPSVPSSLLAMMPILPGPGCHPGCHPGTQAVRSQGRTCSIYLCLQPLQLWSIQLFWDQTQLAQHLAERARACLEDFGWEQPSSLGMLRQQPWLWDGDQKNMET